MSCYGTCFATLFNAILVLFSFVSILMCGIWYHEISQALSSMVNLN